MSPKKLDYSVVICALARDCGPSLLKNIPRIEQLRKNFQSSSVIIVENDSKDDTKEILKRWSTESEAISVISEDFNTVTIPSASHTNLYPGTSLFRIEKMASYRNIYLDWIDQQDRKFDVVIMIDVDVEEFSVESIIESISYAPDNWGGIFANGYTDTKIFGKEIYTMFHDMYAYCEKLPIKKPYFTYKKLFKLKKSMNKKLSYSKFLPVLSAFGGFGIYKSDAISGLRYKAIKNGDKYMEAVCEHVFFNYRMNQKGYGAYISVPLKVYYGKSDYLMTIRNITPLWLFKSLCLLFKFRKLKE